MYKFYLDITSLSVPVVAGTYIEVNPIAESNGIKVSLEDGIFGKKDYDGKIKFVNDEYEALVTLKNSTDRAKLKVTSSGTQIFEGYVNLYGEYDIDNKTCQLEVDIIDEYSDVITNRSKDINVLQCNPVYAYEVFNKVYFEYATETYSPLVITWNGDYIDSGSPNFEPITSVLAGGSTRPADHWKCYTSEYTKTASFPVKQYSVVTVWVREYSYKRRLGDVKNPESPSDGWYYDSTITFDDGTVYDKYVRIPYNNAYQIYTKANANWPDYRKYTLNLPTDQYINYTRGRLLTDIIKYVVGEMDSTILFDSSSFSYFDNNTDLKNIIVSELSDFVPSEITGLEKDEGAEIGMINFDDIFNFLKEVFKIYWLLEQVGSDYYFRIKHRSEILYTLGTEAIYDLTTYKNTRWDGGNKKFTYKVGDKWYRLKRNVEAQNPDFMGVDILCPYLQHTDITKEVTYEKFLFDVWDIIARPSNYSGGGRFVMMNCSEIFGSNLANNTVVGPLTLPFIAKQSGYNLDFTWNNTNKSITAETTATTNDSVSQPIVSTTYGTYVITFSLQIISGNAPRLSFVFTDQTVSHTLSSGANTITQFKNNDSNFTIKITLTGAGKFIITNFSIKAKSYQVRNVVGALSGQAVANGDLSIANIDANHGKYDMPSETVIINGVQQTLTSTNKQKDKEINEIAFPCSNPDDIDFTKLVKTSQGNIEITELNIFFDKKHAKIKGVY